VPGKPVGVDSDRNVGIANGTNEVAHNFFDIDGGVGGNFSGDVDHVSCTEGFDRTARVFVTREESVEQRVTDLVTHFVGVTLCDRF